MKNATGDLARKVTAARVALAGGTVAEAVLADLVLDVHDPGPALAWIAAYDDALAARALELLRTVAPTAETVEVLDAALDDPDLAEDRRRELALVLPLRAFADVVRKLPQTLEGLAALHDGITSDAASAGSKELAAALEIAVRLGPPFGPSLQILLAAYSHGRGVSDIACADMLRSAAASRDPRAAWMIGELARTPGMGRLTPVIESLAADGCGSAWPLPPLERAWIAGVDADGLRAVGVALRGGATALFVSDFQGIRHVMTCFGSKHPRGRDTVPVNLATARAFVADFLSLHAESCAPVPDSWLLARPFLGVGPLMPQRREPDLSAYSGPPAVDDSGRLAWSVPYGAFLCWSQEAFDFLATRRGRLKAADEARFLREIVCSARERERIVRCLAAKLDIESLAGRASQHRNRRAFALWRALTSGALWEQVPYVRELARSSLRAVREFLRRGITCPEEASRYAAAC